MTPRGVTVAGVLFGLLVLGAVASAGAATTIAFERWRTRRAERAPASVATALPPVAASVPIGPEAGVFRTHLEMLAVGDPATPRRPAKPRTLHTYRTRRAFPGAPPRVPHGLTGVEFQTVTCNSCHERGGYSPRFSAYVPVTPHPELEACLQCHVPDDEVTGVALPSHDPNTICRQCHDPTGLSRGVASIGWSTSLWPTLSPKTPNRAPPPIPHDLQMRGNCLTCHAGPGGVVEIQTSHPQWTDCRECHLPAGAAVRPFVRPAAGTAGGGGIP